MKFFKKFLASVVILMAFSPVFLLAEGTTGQGGTGSTGQGGTGSTGQTIVSFKINNPFNCGGQPECTLITLVKAILNNIIMPIAAVFITLWIIYAGFQFVMANGKPAEIENAKKNLLWALIGAGVLLGAAGIATVVETTVRSVTTF